MEQTSNLAEEPKGLKMASSWGLRPPEAHKPFSLPQSLVSIICQKIPQLNYNQPPASALGFRPTLDPRFG